MRAVKLASDDGSLIEGHAVPFGGPFNGRDLAGEYFTAKTDLCLGWFPEDRPLLYQHGLDGDVTVEVVGRVKMASFKADDEGGWVQAQLDASHRYFDQIKKLVEAGKLYFSSGAMAHLVQTTKSGEITRWPWVELSLTPTPCNLLADVGQAKAHFKAVGLDLPDPPAETKAALKDGMQPEGCYEDLIRDLSRLVNPVSPYGYGPVYCYVVATFPGYFVAERYDEGEGESTYWRQDYRIGDDREPVLSGSPVQVEWTPVPVGAATQDELRAAPLAVQAGYTEHVLGAFGRHTKGLAERRLKEGRVLSQSNRARLAKTADAMRSALGELDGLLTATDPATAKAELGRRDYLARQLETLRLYAAMEEIGV